MRVPITYIASSGNTYNLISDGIKHREANYWEAYKAEGTQLQYGFRIADFSKDAKTYKTTLMFYGPEVRRRALISALHDDFENDIRRKSRESSSGVATTSCAISSSLPRFQQMH